MRRKTLILCSTAMMMAWTANAHAQTADAAADQATTAGTPATQDPAADAATGADVGADDIVVTGIRESLRSSANLKRNAIQVVDAVVAEDIGKLPDLAVSDTAARIPGVQVIRLAGEASEVLIRGLGEQFFNTLYNGREIFTAERRQVALQDFPSAGIAALEVYKTSTADQVQPGVIGLTNVRSRRPFDINGFELAGNVWGLHTVQAGKVTPNGNILISNRWDTGIGEIGFLANASYTELQYLDSEPSNTDFIADPVINGTRVRIPDIQRLFYRSGNRTRPSGNAAFQWRPNSSLEFYAEGLYQGFRNKIDDTLAAVPLFGGQSYSNIVLRPGTNLVSSGTVVNPGGRIFQFRGGTFNKTDTYQFAVGGRYEANGLKITADVAKTKSTFVGSTESVDTTYGLNGYTVNFNNEVPEFAVSGFNVADPNNYRFQGLFEQAQRAEGDDWQARIDAEYSLDEGFIRTLQIGARYTDRNASRRFGDRFFGGLDVPVSQVPLDYRPVEAGFNGVDGQPFRTFLAPTYGSIRGNTQQLRQFVIGRGATNYTLADVAPSPFQSYDADEKTYAAYGQVGYNFSDVIDGAIGLRVLRAEVSVAGNTVVDGVLTPSVSTPKSTEYLPNASVRWRIQPNLQLRLSYTQTVTRPDYAQLNPAFNYGAPEPFSGGGTIRRGSGGNPNLRPYKSDNYDASLEWYFTRTGFASATVFRREIQDFIQSPSRQFIDPVFGRVEFTQPVNLNDVRINGAEAQISTFFDFDFLPDFLRSFGIQANMTYIDDAPELQEVSEFTYNIVGLFERGPISARLTYNNRSSFLDFQQDRGDDVFRQFGNPPERLDFSLNVAFTPKTTLFFDATNLLNDEFRYGFTSARAGAPRAEYPRFLRYDEQTFSVGLRFRY
jgi:TonB-dependent receptor